MCWSRFAFLKPITQTCSWEGFLRSSQRGLCGPLSLSHAQVVWCWKCIQFFLREYWLLCFMTSYSSQIYNFAFHIHIFKSSWIHLVWHETIFLYMDNSPLKAIASLKQFLFLCHNFISLCTAPWCVLVGLQPVEASLLSLDWLLYVCGLFRCFVLFYLLSSLTWLRSPWL